MGRMLRKLRKSGSQVKENKMLLQDCEILVKQCEQMDQVNRWLNNEIDKAVDYVDRLVGMTSSEDTDFLDEVNEWVAPYLERIKDESSVSKEEECSSSNEG